MLVKVHNKNVHDYSEPFRDRIIKIPAQSYIEMDEDEADYFVQQFTFPKKDAQGVPDPKHFKMLKIERPAPKVVKDELVCHANGARAGSPEELKAMVEGFKSLLVAAPEDDGELKKQNQQLKKENKELKSRLDLIEEKLGLKSEAVA